MKKIIVVLLCISLNQKSQAQAAELAQLALNIEKLAQFRQILEDLKKGYQILYGGYNNIKNISSGNFKLHQGFLDGLLQVSPAVKQYKRIADIVSLQVQLVKEYKAALTRFRNSNAFSFDELEYMAKVYDRLFKESLHQLDELANVVTANKLRMSDDERLTAIDRLFTDMQDKMSFLRHFNNNTSILQAQRKKEQQEVNKSREIYQIK